MAAQTLPVIGWWLLGIGLLLLPPRTWIGSRAARGPTRSRRSPPPARRRSATAGAGLLAAGLLLGLPWWVALAGACLAAVVVARLPVRESRAARIRERGLLVVHADLLAGCLESGLPVGTALAAVRMEMEPLLFPLATPDSNGPAALQAWGSVAALLAVGADVDTAWRPAAECPELAAVAAAARRSALAGTPLAVAVRAHAAILRAESVAQMQSRAARAGVMMTAPLGVCFLPAFLCLGLAPVIIGLLGTLHVF